MSTKLNGSKFSRPGDRCPTELLPTAIRYERARARVFEELGDYTRASQCAELVGIYERRVELECF